MTTGTTQEQTVVTQEVKKQSRSIAPQDAAAIDKQVRFEKGWMRKGG